MINIDIYHSKVQVVLLETHEESAKYVAGLNRKYNKDFEIMAFEGRVFTIPNRVYQIVLLKKFINLNLLFHEIYHVVSMIGDDCGLENNDCRESRAYLQGFIGEKIINYLVDKQKLLILN